MDLPYYTMPQIHWGRDSLQRQGFRVGPGRKSMGTGQIPKLNFLELCGGYMVVSTNGGQVVLKSIAQSCAIPYLWWQNRSIFPSRWFMSSSLSIPNACLIGPDKPCDDKKATISWEFTSDIKHQRGLKALNSTCGCSKYFKLFLHILSIYLLFKAHLFNNLIHSLPHQFCCKISGSTRLLLLDFWKKNKINWVKSYMFPGWIRFTFCFNPLNPSKKSIDGFPSIPISPWHSINESVRVMTGSLCVWSGLPRALGSCPGPSSVRNECLEPPIAHMLHVIMVYLPTQLGDLMLGKLLVNVPAPSFFSHMGSVWDQTRIGDGTWVNHGSKTDKSKGLSGPLGLWLWLFNMQVAKITFFSKGKSS